MARKPNYDFERKERERAKAQKNAAKAEEKQRAAEEKQNASNANAPGSTDGQADDAG